jgi:hypothetical protein
MDLDTLVGKVGASSVGDWHLIDGDTGFQAVVRRHASTADVPRLDVESHVSWWTFRPDVSVALAYGLPYYGGAEIPVNLPAFPKSSLGARFADVMYQGVPAYRLAVLDLDDSRCLLPMPWHATVGDADEQLGWEVVGFTVPASDLAIARLLNRLRGHTDETFDSYLERSEIIVLPDR